MHQNVQNEEKKKIEASFGKNVKQLEISYDHCGKLAIMMKARHVRPQQSPSQVSSQQKCAEFDVHQTTCTRMFAAIILITAKSWTYPNAHQ